MPRTLAQAQSDYDAVHAAWLDALKAESMSQSNGTATKSMSRPASAQLYDQMMKLSQEISRLSGNGGPFINVGVPRRDY